MSHRDLAVRAERDMSLIGQRLQASTNLRQAQPDELSQSVQCWDLAVPELLIHSDSQVFGVHPTQAT